ncbi:uncharacterized protein LOC106667245 isoform X2 [Cimex lectularius]|uniref:Cilia- and flagella-associated protein 99 n=1 Tax=Cimex lectularius TaxID=79782 RepID=A0A8I6THY1_CIMLE|nr:uncharacterized protein LOC106667245 isoform X2 [Cimex lectularius]
MAQIRKGQASSKDLMKSTLRLPPVSFSKDKPNERANELSTKNAQFSLDRRTKCEAPHLTKSHKSLIPDVPMTKPWFDAMKEITTLFFNSPTRTREIEDEEFLIQRISNLPASLRPKSEFASEMYLYAITEFIKHYSCLQEMLNVFHIYHPKYELRDKMYDALLLYILIFRVTEKNADKTSEFLSELSAESMLPLLKFLKKRNNRVDMCEVAAVFYSLDYIRDRFSFEQGFTHKYFQKIFRETEVRMLQKAPILYKHQWVYNRGEFKHFKALPKSEMPEIPVKKWKPLKPKPIPKSLYVKPLPKARRKKRMSTNKTKESKRSELTESAETDRKTFNNTSSMMYTIKTETAYQSTVTDSTVLDSNHMQFLDDKNAISRELLSENQFNRSSDQYDTYIPPPYDYDSTDAKTDPLLTTTSRDGFDKPSKNSVYSGNAILEKYAKIGKLGKSGKVEKNKKISYVNKMNCINKKGAKDVSWEYKPVRKRIEFKTMPIIRNQPPVIQNNANVLRDAKILAKEKNEQLRRLDELISASQSFVDYESILENYRQMQEEEEILEIERKHLAGLISREEAILAKQNLMLENAEKRKQFEKEKKELESKLEEFRAQELINAQRVVWETREISWKIKDKQCQISQERKKLGRERYRQRELNNKQIYEKRKEELDKKIELVRQFKAFQIMHKETLELHKLKLNNLYQMSSDELKIKIEHYKQMLRDELQKRQCLVIDKRLERKTLLIAAKGFVQEMRQCKKDLREESIRRRPLRMEVRDTKEILDLKTKYNQARIQRVRNLELLNFGPIKKDK